MKFCDVRIIKDDAEYLSFSDVAHKFHKFCVEYSTHQTWPVKIGLAL